MEIDDEQNPEMFDTMGAQKDIYQANTEATSTDPILPTNKEVVDAFNESTSTYVLLGQSEEPITVGLPAQPYKSTDRNANAMILIPVQLMMPLRMLLLSCPLNMPP